MPMTMEQLRASLCERFGQAAEMEWAVLYRLYVSSVFNILGPPRDYEELCLAVLARSLNLNSQPNREEIIRLAKERMVFERSGIR